MAQLHLLCIYLCYSTNLLLSSYTWEESFNHKQTLLSSHTWEESFNHKRTVIHGCTVDIGRGEGFVRGTWRQRGWVREHAVSAVHDVFCVCSRRRLLLTYRCLHWRWPGTHWPDHSWWALNSDVLNWSLSWLTSHCPSVLRHCQLGHLTRKIVSEMTYIASSGMLNTKIP